MDNASLHTQLQPVEQPSVAHQLFQQPAAAQEPPTVQLFQPSTPAQFQQPQATTQSLFQPTQSAPGDAPTHSQPAARHLFASQPVEQQAPTVTSPPPTFSLFQPQSFAHGQTALPPLPSAPQPAVSFFQPPLPSNSYDAQPAPHVLFLTSQTSSQSYDSPQPVSSQASVEPQAIAPPPVVSMFVPSTFAVNNLSSPMALPQVDAVPALPPVQTEPAVW